MRGWKSVVRASLAVLAVVVSGCGPTEEMSEREGMDPTDTRVKAASSCPSNCNSQQPICCQISGGADAGTGPYYCVSNPVVRSGLCPSGSRMFGDYCVPDYFGACDVK